VYAENAEVNAMMEDLGMKLKLEKHLVGRSQDMCKELYTPADLGSSLLLFHHSEFFFFLINEKN
jgi:hypothetical protein